VIIKKKPGSKYVLEKLKKTKRITLISLIQIIVSIFVKFAFRQCGHMSTAGRAVFVLA